MPNRLRTLANLTRLALFGTGLLAVGTACVWTWQPERVGRLQAWLWRKLAGPYYSRYDRATAEPDARKAEALMTALADDLGHVRRQDRLARKVVETYSWLAHAAEGRGDLATAAYWADRCVRFDDHSLHTQVLADDLLCRRAETRAAGLDQLALLWQRFPGNPFVAPVLVHDLALADRTREAWDVLQTADKAIRSNLWLVLWDVGAGFDPDARRTQTIPVVEDGVLRVAFSIGEPIRGLELRPPAFSPMFLLEPTLTTTIDGRAAAIDLAAADGIETFQLRRSHGRLQADGGSGPYIRVQLPFLLPADAPIEFRAKVVPMPVAALIDPLRDAPFARLVDELAAAGDAAGAARVRRLRTLALADDRCELFWSSGEQPFASDRSCAAPIDLWPDPGAVRFSVVLAPHVRADTLRLDLPAGIGIAWHIDQLDLLLGGRQIAVDADTVPLLVAHSVERRDGALVVTGDDPYFAFSAPDQAPLDGLLLAGAVR